MAEIIAYHGWGFDRTCWQSWIKRFTGEGHQFQVFDRGYFDQQRTPNTPSFADDSGDGAHRAPERKRVLILHSFGLHLCPIETIRHADRVVIFSSFLCFHPGDPRLNRRSKRVVEKMGDRLQTHPLDVLQQFWVNCYAPGFLPMPTDCPQVSENGVNLPLLHQDLEHLNTVTIDESFPLLTALQSVPSITVIHSKADRIVPLAQGVTLADAVSAPLIAVPDAGHALPFSHPDPCWALAPLIS